MTEQPPRISKLRRGSYIAIELNTLTPVADWDDQEVYIVHEDPAHLTDEGWVLFYLGRGASTRSHSRHGVRGHYLSDLRATMPKP